jgi:hypothetical protein
MRKVKITSTDEHPRTIKVIDLATDEEIKGIAGLQIEATPGGVIMARITLVCTAQLDLLTEARV